MKLGICVGTVTSGLTQLNTQWAYGVGSNSLSDEFKAMPVGIEFVPLVFENEPQANWERFIYWENYAGYWLIGNEPHTDWDGNKTAAEVAPIFAEQIDAITKMDANAKCIVTVSTQGQTPYNPHFPNENFIGDCWKLFSPETRAKVAGFHMHIYPRWISDDPVERWEIKNFVAYPRRMKRWMKEQGIADRELWISEMGYEGFLIEDYAKCITYLYKLLGNRWMNANIARFAFYVGTERIGVGGSNGYLPLLNTDGQMTGLGATYFLHTMNL